jgi:hypothetical protein
MLPCYKCNSLNPMLKNIGAKSILDNYKLNEKEKQDAIDNLTHWIECPDCKHITRCYTDKEAALKDWNNRKVSDNQLSLYQAWLDERQKNRVHESDKLLLQGATLILLDSIEKIATDCYGRPTQMMLEARDGKKKYAEKMKQITNPPVLE